MGFNQFIDYCVESKIVVVVVVWQISSTMGHSHGLRYSDWDSNNTSTTTTLPDFRFQISYSWFARTEYYILVFLLLLTRSKFKNRVIEEHLGGKFAVYQSRLACMGSSPYELRVKHPLCLYLCVVSFSFSFAPSPLHNLLYSIYQSLSTTCSDYHYLPRDWLLLPLWDAMVLKEKKRTAGTLTTCLRMIEDLYDEDSGE